ncbi:unnamed protein product [Psylliodes chrysocephalus]|uniref:Uncharacterized protein n=1 Tax=Psylliodes chrysocephalus TaxID=3402493 RepID=A0A9P0CQW9_9CUCU|nr:unnamed protein product [Psylliodes chrysocephala]
MGMLGAYEEDLHTTVAEMVYGESIRLPGEFLVDHNKLELKPVDYITELRRRFSYIRPATRTRHGKQSTNVFKDLNSVSHVFLRKDMFKKSHESPYEGPYQVVQLKKKQLVICICGKNVTVSIDRVKPAYILNKEQPNLLCKQPTDVPSGVIQTRY